MSVQACHCLRAAAMALNVRFGPIADKGGFWPWGFCPLMTIRLVQTHKEIRQCFSVALATGCACCCNQLMAKCWIVARTRFRSEAGINQSRHLPGGVTDHRRGDD